MGFEPSGDDCTLTANRRCSECPAGKAKDTVGSAKCTPCPKGKFQSDAGRCGNLAPACMCAVLQACSLLLAAAA